MVGYRSTKCEELLLHIEEESESGVGIDLEQFADPFLVSYYFGALLLNTDASRYNAAVFTSVSQNTFVWAVVTESFFRPESYPTIYIESNGTLFAEPKHFYNDEDLHPSLGVAWNGHIADPYHAAMVPFHNDALANLDTYTNMSSIDCIKAYSDMFSFRKNLLLVSRNIDVAIELNNTLLSRRSTRSDGIRWEYDQCRLDTELWGLEGDALVDMERYQTLNQSSIDIIEQGSEGFKIDYCLQQNSTLGEEDFQKCRLQVAPQLLLCKWILHTSNAHLTSSF